MWRTLAVTETLDHFRENLDLAGRRLQRMRTRIIPEIFEEHEFGIGRGNLDERGFPEALELRQFEIARAAGVAKPFIDMGDPFHLAAIFGERFSEAAATSQLAEDIPVVSARSDRCD